MLRDDTLRGQRRQHVLGVDVPLQTRAVQRLHQTVAPVLHHLLGAVAVDPFLPYPHLVIPVWHAHIVRQGGASFHREEAGRYNVT